MTTATPTRPAPLSAPAIARLRASLVALLAERAEVARVGTDTTSGNDSMDLTVLAERDMALEQLDERIARAHRRIGEAELAVLAASASAERDGSEGALPGSRVQLRFGAGDAPETYLLADIEERGELPVVTPASPLGRALLGVRPGASLTYVSPGGTRTVELLAVEAGQPAAA